MALNVYLWQPCHGLHPVVPLFLVDQLVPGYKAPGFNMEFKLNFNVQNNYYHFVILAPWLHHISHSQTETVSCCCMLLL